jgi:hypothetical protein
MTLVGAAAHGRAAELPWPSDPPISVPFRAGERLEYSVRLNVLNAGTATMRIEGMETVRGRRAYHAVFDVRGRVLLRRIDHHYESWFDASNLAALRHTQETSDGGKHYEFHHDRRVYVRDGEERPAVPLPIEEIGLLWYLRSIPLTPGTTHVINRYYRPDRNPIVIKVMRRERVRVPAGEFDAVVVQPVVRSKGLFSESSGAEVWIAETPERPILRLRSRMSIGTLLLELR